MANRPFLHLFVSVNFWGEILAQVTSSKLYLPSCLLCALCAGLMLIVLCLVLLCKHSIAFYVPGVTPVEYPIGSPVRIKVNSITSTKTAIPYDFYDLPFCRPWGTNPKPQVENFGEILWGDSIKPVCSFCLCILQNPLTLHLTEPIHNPHGCQCHLQKGLHSDSHEQRDEETSGQD